MRHVKSAAVVTEMYGVGKDRREKVSRIKSRNGSEIGLRAEPHRITTKFDSTGSTQLEYAAVEAGRFLPSDPEGVSERDNHGNRRGVLPN